MSRITIEDLEEMKKTTISEKREKDLADEIIEDLDCWVSQYNGVVTSNTTYEQVGFGFLTAEPDTQDLLDQGFYNRVDGSYDIIEQINEDE